MISKSLPELCASDIDRLIAEAIEEGTQIDFKQALVGNTRDDKKAFAADICAFANAHGGDLVLGIKENSAGAAGEVIPLTLHPDDEILRMENMLSECIEPKLFGVRMRAVPYTGGHVLVIRVPRSIQGLHRSRLDQHFYVRESKSNRQLDVPAIVTRVEGLQGGQTKLEEFFAQRYAAVLADNAPVPLWPGPKVVVHLFTAYQAFSSNAVDVTAFKAPGTFPVPTRPSGLDARMTYEGVMHHAPISDGRLRAYSLVHHTGVIEGVWKVADPSPVPVRIGPEQLEVHALRYVADVIPKVLSSLSMEMPIVIRIALIGAEGAIVESDNQDLRLHFEDLHLSAVSRSALALPDVLLDEWPIASLPDRFRPCFDRLWHTSGYSRSFQYQARDGQVVWRGRL